jgi:amino acid transporter
MAGWGALLATVIVLSNLAGVAVTFFYLMLGQVTGSQAVVDFGDRTEVHVLTCLAFVAIATAVAYKGTALTKRVQYVLVGFQLAVLLLFTVLAVVKAVSGDAPDTVVDPELAWLDITQVPSFSAFTAGLSLSLFIYWGWDTCLSVNEETEGSSRTPGRAALLTMAVIVVTYVGVAVALQMYAGVGTEGLGLGNPETSDNVFAALAGPVMGQGPRRRCCSWPCWRAPASSLQTTVPAAGPHPARHGDVRRAAERFAARHPGHAGAVVRHRSPAASPPARSTP